MQVNPYIHLNGEAREAIQFYEKVFEAENLGIITYVDMPENPDFPLPPETKDRVAHGAIKIGESVMMFSDSFPDEPTNEGSRVSICIEFYNAEKARQTFEALQEGGQVEMPIAETSFSPAYGILKDKFGVTFHFYTEERQE